MDEIRLKARLANLEEDVDKMRLKLQIHQQALEGITWVMAKLHGIPQGQIAAWQEQLTNPRNSENSPSSEDSSGSKE